jgi:poly(3-hydroxybutyrate) depolymerase
MLRLVALALVTAALAAPQPRVLRLPTRLGSSTPELTAYVPSSAAPPGGLPLVMMLSGYCLPANQQDSMQLGYKALAEQRGFVYLPLKSFRGVKTCALCPTTVAAIKEANRSEYSMLQMYVAGEQITAASTAAGACTAWDATPACCSENEGKNGGDVPLLTSIIDLAAKELPINRSAVYVVGVANGGFMAQRMACDVPDRLAGVVAYASGIDVAACNAPGRVPLLLMHGDADLVVPYSGGTNGRGVTFPGFVGAAGAWAARNGCALTPTTTAVTFRGSSETYTVDEAEYSCQLARTAAWRIEKGNHFAAADVSAQMFAAALGWAMGA